MGKHPKSGKTKTSVAGAVIAAICIVIYLGALVQASVRFYLSIDKLKFTADQEFNSIAALALSDGRRGFMDDQFKETMKNALMSSKSLEAIIISSDFEGEYAFERQKGYAVKLVNNSPRFIKKLSLSDRDYSRPLSINNLRNVNIMAAAKAFDYNELSKILKETLLIILVGFAISFFTLLLQMLSGKTSDRAKPVPVDKTPEPARESVSAARDNFGERDSYTDRDNHRDIESDAEIESTESGPKGLYSSRSNIGWEDYTKDRLDSELHRCASTEKDLTLIYMSFTDITNDTMYRQAAEEAVAFFTSRDLLFEYGKYGICAILPGINLDTGIVKAEKFHQRFLEKFPGGGRYVSSLCIGLSSRSGRLLNAERLMMEVTEALNRAKKDPKSSIIAFKSDLDKYRAFIASQN